jgi:hypothetical protein
VSDVVGSDTDGDPRLVVVRLVGVVGSVVVVSAPADVARNSGAAISEAVSSKVLSLINLRKVGVPSTIVAEAEIAIARDDLLV